MRGEHKDSLAPAYRRAGSFPHARGAPAARAAQRVPGGIIPACAGGALRRQRERKQAIGIIPACAGSTRPRPPHTCRPRDYPRMRGEHTSPSWHRPPSPESSPHVRGAPDLLAAPLVGLGIIPACAGSTRASPPTGRLTGDHPRMRGEHCTPSACRRRGRGSSPHARGARRVKPHLVVARGIIPACAGSTASVWVVPSSAWDHPRMRGEHDWLDRETILRKGSSPHARGAQARSVPP